MHKKRLAFFIALLTMLGLILSSFSVAAQSPRPPTPPVNPEQLHGSAPSNAQLTSEGLWYTANEGYKSQNVKPLASGGPDLFNYTWDDTAAVNYIDVSDGVNSGISSTNYASGLINIGFPFKYYENDYTQLFISGAGFLAFNNNSLYENQSRIPNSEAPNDVIAPNWMPIQTIGGYVNYKRGGSAPNRWFVVEWNRVRSEIDSEQSEFTFEVILYEKGDIEFQYGNMNYGNRYFCQSSGIEDSSGTDGLAITSFCSRIVANHAVKIIRPAPSARISLRPLYQGQLTSAGAMTTFQVPIRNNGEMGTDIYDLVPSSTWPLSLFKADGSTVLTDTDGDSKVDTGPVLQGMSATVVVKVQVPPVANVASSNTATLFVQSSLNPAVSRTVSLTAAIPAPFAQSYRDPIDGTMSLYRALPSGQAIKKASPGNHYGYAMSVAESPYGNLVNAWSKYRCLGDQCNVHVGEIYYTILNHNGDIIRPMGKLNDLSTAQTRSYDDSPTIAIAPDGRIGILWLRRLYNNADKYNSNLFFAVLDSAGNLLSPPVNLTNNNAWGDWNEKGNPSFYNASIAASADNRFLMAWERQTQETGGYLNDIYYAVRDSGNNAVGQVVNFTNNNPPYDRYYGDPAVSALNNNRVLLAWNQWVSRQQTVAYAILDSAGNIVVGATLLNKGGWGIDAVQLSTDHIALAWASWSNSNNKPELNYAILDGSTYTLKTGPTPLVNPASISGDDYVSVTADRAGHAILTWMESDYYQRQNLYYALIDDVGSLLTKPMIFRTSGFTNGLETSYQGFGNTTYTVTPTNSQVDTYITAPGLINGMSQSSVLIPVVFGNSGSSQATSVSITMTLDPNLTYVSDSIGVDPIITGKTLTWNLPTNLDFMVGNGQFSVRVAFSNSAFGSKYPIVVQITSAGPEGNQANNTANINIIFALQSYLPVIRR